MRDANLTAKAAVCEKEVTGIKQLGLQLVGGLYERVGMRLALFLYMMS